MWNLFPQEFSFRSIFPQLHSTLNPFFSYSYSININISSNSFNLEVSFFNDTHSNTYIPSFSSTKLIKNEKFLKFNKCGTFFLKNSHSKAYFLNFIQSWTLFPYSYSFKINISSNSFNLEVSFLNDTHPNTYFPKFIQYGTVFCYLYSFKINISSK